jgi:hypothetical protein
MAAHDRLCSGHAPYTDIVSPDLDDTIARPRRPLPDGSFRAAPGVDAEDTVLTAGAATRRGDSVSPSVGESPLSSLCRVSIDPRSEPILLDRPCVIGRRPSAPRIAQGPSPRLVRVHSPLKEVSSTHLEVRQLGSSVVVTDLRSTNGSVVMVPGRVPRKLRQGESLVVSPGTLVDIGDDNILKILPIQRRDDGGVRAVGAGDRP